MADITTTIITMKFKDSLGRSTKIKKGDAIIYDKKESSFHILRGLGMNYISFDDSEINNNHFFISGLNKESFISIVSLICGLSGLEAKSIEMSKNHISFQFK